jgi:hypothetical protein
MFMHTTSFVKSTDENSLFSDRGGNPEKWDSIVDWTTLVDGVETNHAGETNYLTWNNTAYQSICLADADVDHFGHYHPGYSHDMHIASFGPGLDGSTDTIYRFFTPILNKGNISPENFLPRNSSMYYNKSKKALIYTQFSKSTNRAIYLSKEYLDKSKITGKVNIDASLHGATTEVTNTDDDGNTTTTTVYSGFYWDAQRYDYKIRILAGNDTVSVPLDNDVIEMSPIYWDTSGVLWPSVLKGDAVILNHQEPSEHIIATAAFGSTHRGVVVNLNEINGEIIPTLNEVCLFDNSITNSVHPSALLFTDIVRAQGEVNIETDGTLNTNSGNFNFSTNEYFYKYSFLYDGFQDGPLCSLEVMANGTLTGTGDYADAIEISMTLRGVPARVTHINLWRKDNRDAEYRIVKSIKYDSSWKYEPLVSSEPSTLISGRAQKRIIDRGGQYASYEALSGMPETINNFTIGYKYSTEINGELFIAGCKADFIDSSENFIFKSQPGKFSMFNWLDFRIDLKDTVVGIENYLGRVYAFTKDNCYVINPASMSVDDVYHGLGIKHSKCVYANKHGLVVASNDNIYLNIQGGMAFTPIGNAIYTSNDKSITETWQNIDKQTIKIGWSEKKSSYIIFFHDGKQKAWLFNPQSTRWDLIDFPVDVKDITTSIDGLTVYSTGTNLYSMFTSPLKRVWKWFSKAFTVGNPTQDKFFRKLKFTNTLKDKFPDVVTTVEGSSIFIDNPQYDLKKENIEIDIKKTAKWFKIKMFDKTFRESKIDSLGLLFRRKSAK